MLRSKQTEGLSQWFVIGCLVLFLATTFSYACMHQNLPVETVNKAVYVRVPVGMNANGIAALLYEREIIDNILAFKIMAKLNGLDNHLRAGGYTFYPNMKYRDIIDDLVNGRFSALKVTIPEGYNVEQIASLLQEKGLLSAAEFKQAAQKFAPFDYIAELPGEKYCAEGFLFPDTYEFAADASAEEILTIMAKEFDGKLTSAMRQRANDLNLTIQEVVILASLVEKEAQVAEDRPIIAQVFINRLRAFMPLQSCATIQYILGTPKAELSIQDTQLESPYNTYQHMGLPPGAIANPGIAAIEAVLFSEPTEYLYFVADKNGKHSFSRTYAEHLTAIGGIY